MNIPILAVLLLLPAIAVSQTILFDRQPAIVTRSGATRNAGHQERTANSPDAGDVNTSAAVAAADHGQLPQDVKAFQNYPNPFNPTTKIEYNLESAAQVSLKVYNLLGQEIATLVHRHQDAGRYIVPFNAINLSSGVYFYRLEAGSSVSIKRLVLIK